MEESKNQYDWDKKCPCCNKFQDYIGKEVKGSSKWAYDYTCNNCKSTWTVIYGDKMGGGFDTIEQINCSTGNKIIESAKFFMKVADEAFLKNVSPDLIPILTPESIQMWKTGYITAYVEFQKSHNQSSKN